VSKEAAHCALRLHCVGVANRWFHARRAQGREEKRPELTIGKVDQIQDQHRAANLLPDSLPLPSWISTGSTDPYFISLRNCLLNPWTGETSPHSPDYFCLSSLPYDYDPTAVSSELDGYLYDWFGDDAEQRAIAQEWAGYVLSRSDGQQVMLLTTGEGNNGKTAYSAMIEALVGRTNCSFVPFSDFGRKFQLAHTEGKLLNICDDFATTDRICERTLKIIISG
jgi:phage/plasmid-associated DNA primase